MNKKSNIKILVAYHKKSEIIKSDIITPIHVGREVATSSPDYNWLQDNMIGDNTGDHISAKNPNYCELTALYWAWKNLDVDYVGLMHYRRVFNFGKILDMTHEYGTKVLNKIGLNDEKIKNLLKNNITIYYLRPKCQYDSFKVVDNYAKHKLLERFDCSKYVTSERNNFSGEVVDYDIISEYGIQSTEINYILLTIFGAKEDYRNFTVDELYTILNLIYKNQKYKEGKGVQSIYKKIREALLIKKNSNDLFDNDKYKENLYLYSKTHGRFYPCNELYYWDNDRLPKSILGNYPNLI